VKKEKDILVIDDEQVITSAVDKICSAEGMSVDIAEQGAVGLDLLGKCSYRLIICDIMMSDVDGFQFLEEAGRRNVSTPVVMATGYSTVENAVKSLYCGAIDFIPKPFTADELLTVVHRGLKYDALRKEAAAGATGRVAIVFVPCPPKYYRLGYISWVMVEPAGTVLVGLTDLFLKTIDGIRHIELSPIDDEVVQGNSCAVITSADGLVHNAMCPISGRIVEVNGGVAEEPARIEKDPYFAGWLYRVLPSDLEYDLQHLTSCSSDRL
jgi:CheY-like chemotaxis protein/glycine cleavage system H lipoate-binding protein